MSWDSTVTSSESAAVPPGPVQLNVNVVNWSSAGVLSVPDVVLGPDQPPLALHCVALVELHVSVLELPGATVDGSADKVTEGAGGCAAESLPLPPQPVSHAAMAKQT